MKVAGSVAVITGGARGIGLALAKSLAADGAKVVLGDILDEPLRRSVREIQLAGGEAAAVVADVTRDEDVVRLMDTAVERFGAINIVCANAGIIRDGLMLNRDSATGKVNRTMTTDEFRAVLEVNLVGAFVTVREGARRMVDHAWQWRARRHFLDQQVWTAWSDQLFVLEDGRGPLAEDPGGRVPYVRHQEHPRGRDCAWIHGH